MILAVLEAQDQNLKKISLEILQAAKTAADAVGAGGVCALLIGPGSRQIAGQAGAHGAQRALSVEGSAFENYAAQAHALAVQAAAAACDAKVIVFGATAYGRDLAPRVSVMLGAGLASDVTALSGEEGSLRATRPVYAGKAYAQVAIRSPQALVTVRPNAFGVSGDAGQPIEAEALAVEVAADAVRAHVKEVRRQAADRVELTEAEIVVSGGRGLKEADNFVLVEQLAEALGAAVGATRAVVDAGWRPHAEQVGQTGKTVSPGLYIACGISGAVQHLAGMSSSRTIVAINRDADAPIFKIADYGIAGDALDILPKLTEAVRKLKD